MLRDITLGQFILRIRFSTSDPRTKFLGTMAFIISVFLFNTFPGYAVATLFLGGLIFLSKVPVKFIFKGLKAIFVILLITVAFNILLTPGEILWKWGFLKVTKKDLFWQEEWQFVLPTL